MTTPTPEAAPRNRAIWLTHAAGHGSPVTADRRARAHRAAHSHGAELVGEFLDAGTAGTLSVLAWSELLAFLNERKASVLLAFEASEIAVEPSERLGRIAGLDEAGVRLVGIDSGNDQEAA